MFTVLETPCVASHETGISFPIVSELPGLGSFNVIASFPLMHKISIVLFPPFDVMDIAPMLFPINNLLLLYFYRYKH